MLFGVLPQTCAAETLAVEHGHLDHCLPVHTAYAAQGFWVLATQHHRGVFGETAMPSGLNLWGECLGMGFCEGTPRQFYCAATAEKH